MDQLIETFEYVRLHRKNWHGDLNVSVDPLAQKQKNFTQSRSYKSSILQEKKT